MNQIPMETVCVLYSDGENHGRCKWNARLYKSHAVLSLFVYVVSAVVRDMGVGHYSMFIVPSDLLRKRTEDKVWLSSSRHAMVAHGEGI